MSKNALYILSTLFFIGCGEQKDFVHKVELAPINTNGTLYYDLYKTGIDNYKYEFKISTKQDTLDVFEVHLNDATYKNIEFNVKENRDTIFINSNWNLGRYSKLVKNKMVVLKE
ncbi:hypothetical protein AAG747_28555 [Rapidithrix thailandica]|uniref:Uncharacterized protein n=1 Tax=Rapidithrix thailandica TaxID=413964 RepID=A0AAW9SEV0_9BACT